MAKPRKWFTRFRSARSGRYVSQVEADAAPDTTVGEKHLTKDVGGAGRVPPHHIRAEDIGEGPEDAAGL